MKPLTLHLSIDKIKLARNNFRNFLASAKFLCVVVNFVDAHSFIIPLYNNPNHLSCKINQELDGIPKHIKNIIGNIKKRVENMYHSKMI